MTWDATRHERLRRRLNPDPADQLSRLFNGDPFPVIIDPEDVKDALAEIERLQAEVTAVASSSNARTTEGDSHPGRGWKKHTSK